MSDARSLKAARPGRAFEFECGPHMETRTLSIPL